jgi:hypothetical protein
MNFELQIIGLPRGGGATVPEPLSKFEVDDV